MKTFLSKSAAMTKKIAQNLAQKSKIPAFFCLYGDLGSGKTTFSKGFARGLGINEKQLKSPTYTFVRSYKRGRKILYHFDFYRIEEADDIMARDLEEIFDQKNVIILIEWPERVEKLLPQKRTNIFFEYKDPNTRLLTIKP